MIYKVGFAFSQSIGMPLVVAWLGDGYQRKIRQHWIIEKDNSFGIQDFTIPEYDEEGITIGGTKFPWRKMNFQIAPQEDQHKYTYSYGIDGFAEVPAELYEAVDQETNQGNWQDFDEETWMK